MERERFRQLSDTLKSAFPTFAELSRMVKMGLDENLETIASDHNVSHAVFDLMGWAEARGLMEELIQAAYQDNPNHPGLKAFIEETDPAELASPTFTSASSLKPTAVALAPHPLDLPPSSTTTVSFGILHLTDLHFGLRAQERYLPGVLADFYKDLEILHRQSGPWDIILFSGDLVQSGQKAEFDGLQKLLDDLWQRLDRLGSHDPILLAVPGNHDLARPDAELPEVYALQDLASTQGKRGETIWTGVLSADPPNRYRTVLNGAFQAYANWWQNCPYTGKTRSDLTYHAGPLPGDFSAVLEKKGARLGIVGLNTTFLQLTGDNYEGKLAVDVRQFNQACNNQGALWFEDNIDACLLMTHQPPSWLEETNRNKVLFGEIDVPPRFAAHFCGHMHTPDATTRGSGWAQERRLVRGGSLFGIETDLDGNTERIHAYAACRIELPVNTDTGKIRLWPRIATRRMAGNLEFDRDTAYTLDRTKDDGGTRSQDFDRLRRPSLPSILMEAAENPQ